MKVRTDIRAGAFPTAVNDSFPQVEVEEKFDEGSPESGNQDFRPW